ncbi:MAG TPA: glycosyltransferase [Phnomibacter sp.]|nr:glycosyltransferase [Phnomibacter sp.]
MWIWVIIGTLTALYAVLVMWYKWAWRQLPMYNVPNEFVPSARITVIIPARNEAANIGACLQGLVEQKYPRELLQVLVINDASEDATADIVQQFSNNYPYIQCLHLPADATMQSHKKRAVERGIAAATGELIVCTDADCTHSPLWLHTVANCYQQQAAEFIAAPVVYETESTILSVFQTLDFITLQGITGASVSKKFHTMCNGANIAYSKKAFEAVKGFEGIDALPTGDDMLLMHKIFRRFPNGVVWLKSSDAIVSTQACESWPAFFQQRIRWASKAAYYDDKRMFMVLLLVYLLNLVFLAGLLAVILFNYPLWPLLCWLVVKTTVEMSFLFPVAHFFKRESWMLVFPLFQPLHIVYTVVAGWLGRFGSYRWKGRTIQKPSALVR